MIFVQNKLITLIQKTGIGLILVMWLASSCMEPRKNFIEKPEEPAPKESPQILIGQLIDSQVSGVEYKTTSQKIGLTDQNGHFEYIEGDEIEFMIGELHLGKTPAQTVITPIELANKNTIDHPEVINRLRLLQSLDSDQNPANGILITKAIRNQALALNFNQNEDAFETDAKQFLRKVCSPCQLTDASKAISHFQKRLTTPTLLTGTLKSPNPLIGVGYRLNSGYFGKTDKQGKFLYKANESIRFFIDEINLGESTAKAEMTVLDLANTRNLTAFSVINRQTLLVILDNDNNSSNGIDVSQFSSDTIQFADHDYNVLSQEFRNDTRIKEILAANNLPPSTKIISELKTAFGSSNVQYNPSATIQHVLNFSHTGLVSSHHQILAKDNNIYALSQTASNQAILKRCDDQNCSFEKEIATIDSGINATMALAADQFYFAMANTTNDLSVVTCNPTLATCANPRKLDTGGQKSQNSIHLSLATDDRGIANKIYTVFSHSTDGLFLSKCHTSGNPCTTTPVNTPPVTKTSAVTFKKDNKDYVYIAAENQEGKLLLAYGTDLAVATTFQSSILSGNANEGLTPSIAIKNTTPSNNNLYVLVATIDQTKGNQPMLTRCSPKSDQPIYFASCKRFDIVKLAENSALQMVSMFSPHLYIRNDNEILLLVQTGQSNTRTNLFRCTFNEDNEPANCRWFDLSQGQVNRGYLPRLAVQERTGKLYWISRDSSAEYRSKVFKMNVEF